MTPTFATGHQALALFLEGGAWLTAGGLLGAFHFLSLRTSSRMLAVPSALPVALTLHLVRFALTAGTLTVIAVHGALPLLAATLGLLAARTAVLKAVSGETLRSVMAGVGPPGRLAGTANSSLPTCAGGIAAAASAAPAQHSSILGSVPLERSTISVANKGPRSLP